MGEIKFRAWDKIRKEMHTIISWNSPFYLPFCVYAVGQSSSSLVELGYDNCELMQFTGLKDKNGKEIYEGDVIKWKDPDGIRIAIVSWESGEIHYFDTISKHTFNQGTFIYSDTHDFLEVIGNIYENPELLKQQEGE